MATREELYSVRKQKLDLFISSGINPYPGETKRTHTLEDALAHFETIESEKQSITVLGRVMTIRSQGAIIFVNIFDGTATFQLFFKKDGSVGEAAFDLFFNTIDVGDFIEASGTVFLTKTGQETLDVSTWRILSKSLLPLPDKWDGLVDPEERFRKRYLDILMNIELQDRFVKRSKFWNVIRTYLIEKNFIEVETPVLENTTGGADARPFITHHNALDIEVYLRISCGELWQKRLMVSGIPRTFEIGRIFRNEGMSNEHAQDYTQLEYYMAYADYHVGMEMTKELYLRIASEVFGTTKFHIRGFDIDFAGDWQIYDFCEIIREKFGIDPLDDNLTNEVLAQKLQEAEVSFDPKELNRARAVDMLWKTVRKSLGGPGFLIGVPVYLEPLAKRSMKDTRVVERFQVILAGSEMGKGFTELNDPIDQRHRFEEQQAMRDGGDEEAQMADWEYVEALEHGMPPTFGFGVSERLFSFLLNVPIREAQLFPLMRPKDTTDKNIKKETMVAVVVLNGNARLEKWQELNTIAHLNAAFGARVGKELFSKDIITSKDNHQIKLNIKNAILIKKVESVEALRSLSIEAKADALEVDEFTREMLETTNDKKITEITASKDFNDIEYLGVLIYGPKSRVEKLTSTISLY